MRKRKWLNAAGAAGLLFQGCLLTIEFPYDPQDHQPPRKEKIDNEEEEARGGDPEPVTHTEGHAHHRQV